jgi:hypothetical protein
VRTFEAQLQADEGPGAFVEVPFDVREAFGRARARVLVTINDHTWPTTIAVYGGKYYVGVSRANRETGGVAVGDKVVVTLAPM